VIKSENQSLKIARYNDSMPLDKFIQKVSKLFLEEEQSDEDTLIDMTLETANLIVGSAKVIAEDTNSFVIGTPIFLKQDYINFEYDHLKIISIENDKLIIAIKEIL